MALKLAIILIVAGTAVFGGYLLRTQPWKPAFTPTPALSPVIIPTPELTLESTSSPALTPEPTGVWTSPSPSPRISPRISPSPTPSPTPFEITPSPTGTPSQSRRFIISIENNKFIPDSLEIRAGDIVRWVNNDGLTHWPASDPNPTHTGYPGPPFFDSLGDLLNGEWWEFKFEKVSRWPYHDHSAINRAGGEAAGPLGVIIVTQ